MARKSLRFLFISFLFVNVSLAESGLVDCRVVTGNTTECNPYGSKLIKAKEIRYQNNRKKLIISKTLPVPKKTKVKVISVADMIEKYVKVEEPLRFKGVQQPQLKVKVTNKIISQITVEKKIREMEKQKKLSIGEVVVRQTHPLPEQEPEEVYGFYTIESGDVLGRIANKFEVTKKELRELNDLEKNAIVRIGHKLKIPLEQKMIDSIANAEYIIEAGDTLLSIAYRFNIDLDELIKFNKLKRDQAIQIGQKLALPLPYVIKKIEAEKKKLDLKKAEARKRRLAKEKRVKMIRGFGRHQLRVTATAYSSHKGQTDKTPFLAAWNNRIRPGMKIIAVSRDLLHKYGLRNGSRVRIGGLRGYYKVRDKMNKRFRKRIDIYMGVNRRRALQWGRRSVMLYW